MIESVDDDGSGEIEFVEFVQMMKKVREGGGGMFSKLGGSKFMGKLFGKQKKQEKKAAEIAVKKMGDWIIHRDENIGKSYYFNKKTKQTTWKRPPAVVFYLPDEVAEKFSREEIAAFKEEFAAFDLDGSGAIDKDEVSAILVDLGEDISEKKLNKHWLQ